jgi:hypothetical protein
MEKNWPKVVELLSLYNDFGIGKNSLKMPGVHCLFQEIDRANIEKKKSARKCKLFLFI